MKEAVFYVTASNISDENYLLAEYPRPRPRESATADHVPGGSSQGGAIRPDSHGISVSLGPLQEMSRALDEQHAGVVRKQREAQLCRHYLDGEKDPHRKTGASRFLRYLESQDKSLAEVTKIELEDWALTPFLTGRGKGNLPNPRAFEGAKAFSRFAAQVGYIDAQRARALAECPRPKLGLNSLRTTLQNPAFTPKEREDQIRQTYKSVEKNVQRQAGASGFLAYLQSQEKSLAEVSKTDLEQWGLTTLTIGRSQGKLPNALAFEGAKALCVLAAEVGHIGAQSAQDIAECTRPHYDVHSVRFVLQDSALTHKEREQLIALAYQGVEKDFHRQAGVTGILTHLARQEKPLAEVTKSDLEQWALTTITMGRSRGNLPNARAFEGAKAFCAFAAQVGYIDPQRAQELARCKRPRVENNSLRTVLQMPALTPKEREYHIRLNFQCAEKDTHRQAGANGFLAYLHSQEKPLAEVTTSDLDQWALKSISSGLGQGTLPNASACEGARALCVLAAEVGHIDEQRAQGIAEWTRPQFDRLALRAMLQNPALTQKDREHHIRLSYKSADTSKARQTGASAFLAYLQSQATSLAEASPSDLQRWAHPSIGPGKISVPNALAFEGAKALCALAAEVGYIPAQKAQALAECTFSHFTVDSLRRALQNPLLTRTECENLICLTYQNAEQIGNRHPGAIGFLGYLENAHIPLAEVTKSDLRQWALTPFAGGRGMGNVPNAPAFEGAKGLCALAAEVGYIAPQRAQELAISTRPHFDENVLRAMLAEPGLTHRECEYQIRLNYQTLEKDTNRQAGASGFLAYLERHSRPLAEVTTSDLSNWAFAPFVADSGEVKGDLPNPPAFEGAKALCALAARVGYIDAQRAHDLAQCQRPQFGADALRRLLQNPALTGKARDSYLMLYFQSAEKSDKRVGGAKGFLRYLARQEKSLAEVSKSDLQTWSLTPLVGGRSKNNLPSLRAFHGAKALCAVAAEFGQIDGGRAHELASCTRPSFDLDELRVVLQNPALTSKEREHYIRLTYQSTETQLHLQTGVNGFLAYLESQESSLSEVTKSDLLRWALTPLATVNGKGSVPNQRAFDGAKAYCAFAAEVGYIDPQRAKEIAECPRPQFQLEFLRTVLDNPSLTCKDREAQIRLNYQSVEKNILRQAGATGILAFLVRRQSSLAAVTTADLKQWALTPITAGPGKGNLPSPQAFVGAKALCALAAEVGYIPAQKAQALAECKRPEPSGPSTSAATRSGAGKRTAQSSTTLREGVNKRLRSDDHGASTSTSDRIALPDSDALFRELALLSPPSLLDQHQHARSPQTESTRSLIDELENLEDILGFSGHLY